MKFSRKTSVTAEIPTASMSDIAFLLIIFFMVTTVFSATKGLEFKLPKDDTKEEQREGEEAVFIKVEAEGAFTVDCKTMEPVEILDYLQPKLERNPEKPVILYTVEDAPYQAMIRIYDVLASAETQRGFKVKNISIPTRTEVQEYIRLFGYNPFESTCS